VAGRTAHKIVSFAKKVAHCLIFVTMKLQIVALMAVASAWLPNTGAIEARPVPFTELQPDGTTVTLIGHGDEKEYWVTDLEGAFLSRSRDAET
jgi:hypothetical protein